MRLEKTEFLDFLKSIAKLYLISKSNKEFFVTAKVNPEQWPYCDAREVMREIVFLDKTKGHDFVKFMLFDKVKDYEIKHLDLTLDLGRFAEVYKTNLNFYRLQDIGNRIISKPEFGDEIIQEYLTNKITTQEAYRLSDVCATAIASNEQRIKEGKSLVSLEDYPILSQCIGGFNPGRITLLGAISGFGKTKLAVNLAHSAAKTLNVIYINMEMSLDDFTSMFLQHTCQISSYDWVYGNYTNKLLDLKNAINSPAFKNITVTDGRAMDINDICALIREHQSYELQNFIIVDYDQKITTSSGDEEWKSMLKTIVRLEDLSKQTNSHVIILYQADDEGQVKSSKRSMQPASSVLNFYEDGGMYFIRSMKNRFNKKFILDVDYYPEITKIKERGLYVEVKQKPRET
jgi:hypothetical protein